MHTFLYMLVCRSGQDYADITPLSVSFLRELHPDGRSQRLTDQKKSVALDNASHTLLSNTDRVIVSEVPAEVSAVWHFYHTELRACPDELFPIGRQTFMAYQTSPNTWINEVCIARTPYPVSASKSDGALLDFLIGGPNLNS
jgi:hypothetical protein